MHGGIYDSVCDLQRCLQCNYNNSEEVDSLEARGPKAQSPRRDWPNEHLTMSACSEVVNQARSAEIPAESREYDSEMCGTKIRSV